MSPVSESAKPRASAVALLLVVAAVCVWGLYLSVALVRADFASMGARYRIERWISGGATWTIPEWLEARAALDEALAITPDNPMLHDYQGSLYALRGLQAWRSEVLRKSFFGEALKHQKTSLELRSQNGPAWASLALSQYALDEPPSVVAAGLSQAWRLGKNEMQVRRTLSDLTLAIWPSAPPELKAWLKERYRKGGEGERQTIRGFAKNRGVSEQEFQP